MIFSKERLLAAAETSGFRREILEKVFILMHRKPSMHAGGKMIWRYLSALGNYGNVEIDLNFMYRTSLLPISSQASVEIAGQQIHNIAVLDIHELSAGKLSALLDRGTARDIFDSHFLLHRIDLNDFELRKLFVIYAGMSRKRDIRKLNQLEIDYDEKEFQNRLVPMLNRAQINEVGHIKTWSKKLIGECHSQFFRLLPLKENELEFLTRLIDYGEIQAELISNGALAEKTSIHPALQWAAFNAKRGRMKNTVTSFVK